MTIRVRFLLGCFLLSVLLFLSQFVSFPTTTDTSAEVAEPHLVVNKTYFRNGIPKIVHYTYMDNQLPIAYRSLVESCLKVNPDVQFLFWSDDSAYKLIKLYYPDKKDIYESYIYNEEEKLKKSDLIRLFLLHKFGGIYMDLDTLCQKPLDSVMVNDSCIISTDIEVKLWIMYDLNFALMNSFMACRAQHHFFEYTIKNLGYNSGEEILFTTGPFALTESYLKYEQKYKSRLHEPRFHIAVGAWQIYSPLIDKNLEQYCDDSIQLEPITFRERGCKLLDLYMKMQHAHIDRAVVVHLFSNLGYSIAIIKKTFNIADISGILQVYM